MQKNLLLLLLLCCFAPYVLFSQSPEALSWTSIGTLSRTDSAELAKQKQKLSDWYGNAKNGEWSLALKITDTLAEANRLLGDSLKYYEALYRNKANVYSGTFQYEKTFDYLYKYSEAIQRLGVQDGYVYVDIGNEYFSLEMDNLAQKYYLMALVVFREQGNYKGQCTVYDNLAQLYSNDARSDSSVYYGKLSLSLREKYIGNPFLTANSYMLLGFVYSKYDDYVNAEDCLLKALKLFGDTAFPRSKDFDEYKSAHIITYRLMAALYLDRKEPDRAKMFLDSMQTLAYRYTAPAAKGGYFFNLARYFAAKSECDSADKYVNFYIEECNANADVWSLSRGYTLMAEVAYACGDYKRGYEILQRAMKLNDSLTLLAGRDKMFIVNNAMLQMENQGKIQRQLNEMSLQESRLRETRVMRNYIGLAAILLLLILGLTAWFAYKIRSQNRSIKEINVLLNDSNATKDYLISVLSHDLRTPFNALIGLSESLSFNVVHEKGRQVDAIAKSLNGAAHSAFHLVNDLLQWVNAETNKVKSESSLFAVKELLQELKSIYRYSAELAAVNLIMRSEIEQVNADRNLIAVVCRNLLSNAIRHAGAGGDVEIVFRGDERHCSITVSNSGMMISNEQQQTEFNLKMHQKVQSKGLGLVLVNGVVKVLNGNVLAEFPAGGGVSITVTFPHNGIIAGSAVLAEMPQEKEMLKLSPEAALRVRKLAEYLQTVEVYEVTRIISALKNAAFDGDPEIEIWKDNIMDAVRSGNSYRYNDLLKQEL
jgi:signal transduction histidine kinase